MAIQDLYVPAATENPLGHGTSGRHLPRTRPTLEFPVTTHSKAQDYAHASFLLLFMTGCGAAAMILCALPSGELTANTRYLVVAFLFGAVFYLRRHAAQKGPPILLAISMASVIAGVFFLSTVLLPLPWLAVGLAVAGLVSEAFRFRKHYLHCATAGLFSPKLVASFRRRHRLPPGVRAGATITGFNDAVVSYLTYNRAGVSAPGVLCSPAGGYRERLARTMAVVVLSTVAWASWDATDTMADQASSESREGEMNFYQPLGALAVWFMANFLATCSFAGKAYALQQRQFSTEAWPGLLERLRTSPDPVERNSLWLGFVECDRSPILYPVKSLFRHVWLVGKTGSGKTAYLMFLIDQLIDRGDLSVIYLDLKAMSFEVLAGMQNSAARISQRLGTTIPVKHFTLDHGQATFLLDIFPQQWWTRLPSPQRTGVVLSALSLAYSRAYGESFYTDSAYDLVHFVLQRHPDVRSWADLQVRMEEAIRYAKPWELSEEVKRDGGHAALVVKRLAALPAINNYGAHSSSVAQNAIDFSAAFQSPQHAYFALSAIQNGLVAGEVGRLAIAALLNTACAMKQRSHGVVLIIDEFQELVTSQLGLLLAQARGLGIGVILANQTTSQLVTKDCDLRPIVEGNTSLQAWFQITDDVGREQMKRLGGQQIVEFTSRHVSSREPFQTSYTFSEQIVDRVPGTLVSAVSSDPRRCMLRLTDNEGYACYGDLMFVAQTMYHQTESQYKACCAMPWPAATAETLINTAPPASALAPPAPGPAGPQTRGRSNRLGRKKPPPGNP